MISKFFITAVLLICGFFSFSQGKIDGFYNEKGNGKLVLGLGFEDSKNYFAGRNKIDGLGRSLYSANLYASYGLNDNFDISIAIPFLSSDDNTNFQDILVIGKYRILKKKYPKSNWELSLAAGFSTPLTNYDIGGLNDIGQQATVIETRAVLHYSSKTGWFGTLQSGFSFKTEETPNSLPVTFKVGRALSKWYYDVYYDYQHSFGGIDYLGTPRPQNFREFGADFHKVGGTVYRPFSSKTGGYLSLSYVLSGRNVFQGPAYGIGIVYNFKSKTAKTSFHSNN